MEGAMRNVCLRICFDGTRYHGWQVQENAITIQQVMQDAAQAVLGVRPAITGCSRTDTGVHAREYVCTLKTASAIACERLRAAMCAHLPDDISVMDACDAPGDFHPRYSAAGKEYRYRIWNRRWRSPFYDRYAMHCPRALDLDAMRRAAAHFEGRRDFAGFMAQGSGVSDTVRTISRCEVSERDGLVEISVTGDGFLYNMVRIMAGTLLDCGLAKTDPGDLPGIIASRDRGRAGPTLKAKGLTLYRVFY